MIVPNAGPQSPSHFFTVDVEEYFQVSAFARIVPVEYWNAYPRRLDRTMPVLLEALARAGAKATFFVLGWVAKHDPQVVKRIRDDGHEIASHGFWHQRVSTESPSMFRDDVRAAKQTLEDLTGTAVLGYRAPSFSILHGTEWAFDVLLAEGYTYDSSLFPVRRPGYGYPGAPTVPHVITRPLGTLLEFPLATLSIGGVKLPAAGGAYLRHFPLAFVRRAFAAASARGEPATFYMHPWEIDPDQPRVPVNAVTRLRHYRGLAHTLARVERLLAEFRFTSIASALSPAQVTMAPAVRQ